MPARLSAEGCGMKPYYEDGTSSLYKGDSLGVLANLPTASIDAVVTDPPYSSGGMVRGDRAGANVKAKYSGSYGVQPDHAEFTGDNRDQRAYAYWCALWLSECLRITKPGGLALLFTDWRQLPATTDALQSGGWVWRGVVPWHKPTSRPMPGGFTSACEYVVWGSAGPVERDYANGVYLPGFYQANPAARSGAPDTEAARDHACDGSGLPPRRNRARSVHGLRHDRMCGCD